MKSIPSRILVVCSTALLVTCTGCICVSVQRADPDWPKPIAVSRPSEFSGVYWNRSGECNCGGYGVELFDFVTGQGHQHGDRGCKVRVDASEDGGVLCVRLLDTNHVEIDSAELRRGVDYDIERGALTLHGPFSGGHHGVSNLGFYARHERDRLYQTSAGSLIGLEEDKEAGLVFGVVPVAGEDTSRNLWRRVPEDSLR